LKSSRSRVRGSAAAGSAAVGMAAGDLGGVCPVPSLLFSEAGGGVGMECRRCRFRLFDLEEGGVGRTGREMYKRNGTKRRPTLPRGRRTERVC
jgi:hypothetical protein